MFDGMKAYLDYFELTERKGWRLTDLPWDSPGLEQAGAGGGRGRRSAARLSPRGRARIPQGAESGMPVALLRQHPGNADVHGAAGIGDVEVLFVGGAADEMPAGARSVHAHRRRR